MATPFKDKLQKAQSTCLDFSSLASEPLVGVCTALSDAIGCPVEFIFYPLLTIVAACMGINAHVKVNPIWYEPAILWFIIAANKGQKKTAALRLLKKPLLDIEHREAELWRANNDTNTKLDTPPQLIIDNFSFEELHHVMKRNGSQILGLFDEMSTLYAQLDLYKQSGSVMDRKTLITLNGGSSWSRNYRNYSASMTKTAFNISGFIQPAFVEKMLLSDDADGFNDRQLFAFPPQRDVFLKDLALPIPSHLPSLENVYTILRRNHCQPIEYVFTDEALEIFEAYHDNLVTRQSKQHNENIQGILSKARGFTARLCMVLFALEQAIEITQEHDEDDNDSEVQWSNQITKACVEAATTIMDYLIRQKLIMMDLKEVTADTVPSGDMCTTYNIAQAGRLKRLLLLPNEDDQGTISPSSLTRGHISEPVLGKYKVEKAIELCALASNYGFGSMVDTVTPTRRKVKKFRKSPYEVLSSDARDIMRDIRVTEDEYRSSFTCTSTSNALAERDENLPPADN